MELKSPPLSFAIDRAAGAVNFLCERVSAFGVSFDEFVFVFKRGALFVLVLYSTLFVLTAVRSDKVLLEMNAELASENVLIHKSVDVIQVSDVEKDVPLSVSEQAGVGEARAATDDAAAVSSVPSASADTQSMGVALPVAPLSELAEARVKGGVLPVISDGGLTPFAAYKRSVILPAAGVPVVAIGVSDFGLSAALSGQAVRDLPADVTFLASVYAENLDDWVKKARASGHEVWLEVPFETESYPLADSGPYTLLRRSSLRNNQDHLEDIMASAAGYAGLWGRIDDVLSNSPQLLKGFFEPVFSRGLGYLEASAGYSHTVDTLSKEYKTPYIRPVIRIDGDKVDQDLALKSVMQSAKDYGRAIGLVSPTPAALEALPAWIEAMEREGIVIVPVSAIFERVQQTQN